MDRLDRLARSEVESVVAVAEAMRLERGSEVAVEPLGDGAMVALPATTSARNIERAGLRLVDVQAVMTCRAL